jgi:hypothetical protein
VTLGFVKMWRCLPGRRRRRPDSGGATFQILNHARTSTPFVSGVEWVTVDPDLLVRSKCAASFRFHVGLVGRG